MAAPSPSMSPNHVKNARQVVAVVAVVNTAAVALVVANAINSRINFHGGVWVNQTPLFYLVQADGQLLSLF
jgi:hypothetical protein